MYPTFCSFPAGLAPEEPHFAAVAADSGLGAYRPGLALGEADGHIEVLVAPDGLTIRLPPAQVRLGLPEEAALAMMDAVEEAIEDALDAGADAAVPALERTLALLERSLREGSGEL